MAQCNVTLYIVAFNLDRKKTVFRSVTDFSIAQGEAVAVTQLNVMKANDERFRAAI